ncbi:MAG: CHASE2 domain-containing protein, partial [Elainellaceae cyanobacterium]
MKLRHFFSRLTLWLRALPLPYADAMMAIALTSLTTTGMVLVAQQIGKVEPFELFVYDRLMQLRGDVPPDPRILVVGISEADIIERNVVTPEDKVIADAISIVQESNPLLVGLDLHRNTPNPPGRERLQQELQAENLIVIKKLAGESSAGVAPPADVSPERIGFNNLHIDPDGVVRLKLIIASNDEGTYFSFSLQLAVHYLAEQGIVPQGSAANSDHLQLGEAVFVPMRPRDGGYHHADAAGYQILLNYRGNQVAQQVSLSDVLNRRVDASQIAGKIVLIGSTAESLKDLFFTPYSTGETTSHKMPGVEIHAQMVSQVIDAALGDRPLFWFWPQWAEVTWMW